MAEPGTAGRKHSGLIFSSKGWIGPYRTKAQFKPKGKKHTERVCKSNPRLGHSASRTRLGKPLREDKPAACYVLEPRPTKAVEDEDDDEYENEKGEGKSRYLWEDTSCVPVDVAPRLRLLTPDPRAEARKGIVAGR